MTGGVIDLPFLPEFPLETWNFRIVHVAGALILGFLLFSGARFADSDAEQTRLLGLLSYPLLAIALFALGAAIYFGLEISSGVSWNGLDKGIRFNEI